VHGNEGPGTWGPFDVLGHLIYGEETDWMVRARLIMSDAPDRTFAPFDRQGHEPWCRDHSIGSLLTIFRSLRQRNIDELSGTALTPAQLQRRAVHPELGEVDLAQLLSAWVVHDLHHIGQTVRVMAKQCGDRVGPWSAYLGTLNR